MDKRAGSNPLAGAPSRGPDPLWLPPSEAAAGPDPHHDKDIPPPPHVAPLSGVDVSDGGDSGDDGDNDDSEDDVMSLYLPDDHHLAHRTSGGRRPSPSAADAVARLQAYVESVVLAFRSPSAIAPQSTVRDVILESLHSRVVKSLSERRHNEPAPGDLPAATHHHDAPPATADVPLEVAFERHGAAAGEDVPTPPAVDEAGGATPVDSDVAQCWETLGRLAQALRGFITLESSHAFEVVQSALPPPPMPPAVSAMSVAAGGQIPSFPPLAPTTTQQGTMGSSSGGGAGVVASTGAQPANTTVRDDSLFISVLTEGAGSNTSNVAPASAGTSPASRRLLWTVGGAFQAWSERKRAVVSPDYSEVSSSSGMLLASPSQLPPRMPKDPVAPGSIRPAFSTSDTSLPATLTAWYRDHLYYTKEVIQQPVILLDALRDVGRFVDEYILSGRFLGAAEKGRCKARGVASDHRGPPQRRYGFQDLSADILTCGMDEESRKAVRSSEIPPNERRFSTRSLLAAAFADVVAAWSGMLVPHARMDGTVDDAGLCAGNVCRVSQSSLFRLIIALVKCQTTLSFVISPPACHGMWALEIVAWSLPARHAWRDEMGRWMAAIGRGGRSSARKALPPCAMLVLWIAEGYAMSLHSTAPHEAFGMSGSLHPLSSNGTNDNGTWWWTVIRVMCAEHVASAFLVNTFGIDSGDVASPYYGKLLRFSAMRSCRGESDAFVAWLRSVAFEPTTAFVSAIEVDPFTIEASVSGSGAAPSRHDPRQPAPAIGVQVEPLQRSSPPSGRVMRISDAGLVARRPDDAANETEAAIDELQQRYAVYLLHAVWGQPFIVAALVSVVTVACSAAAMALLAGEWCPGGRQQPVDAARPSAAFGCQRAAGGAAEWVVAVMMTAVLGFTAAVIGAHLSRPRRPSSVTTKPAGVADDAMSATLRRSLERHVSPVLVVVTAVASMRHSAEDVRAGAVASSSHVTMRELGSKPTVWTAKCMFLLRKVLKLPCPLDLDLGCFTAAANGGGATNDSEFAWRLVDLWRLRLNVAEDESSATSAASSQASTSSVSIPRGTVKNQDATVINALIAFQSCFPARRESAAVFAAAARGLLVGSKPLVTQVADSDEPQPSPQVVHVGDHPPLDPSPAEHPHPQVVLAASSNDASWQPIIDDLTHPLVRPPSPQANASVASGGGNNRPTSASSNNFLRQKRPSKSAAKAVDASSPTLLVRFADPPPPPLLPGLLTAFGGSGHLKLVEIRVVAMLGRGARGQVFKIEAAWTSLARMPNATFASDMQSDSVRPAANPATAAFNEKIVLAMKRTSLPEDTRQGLISLAIEAEKAVLAAVHAVVWPADRTSDTKSAASDVPQLLTPNASMSAAVPLVSLVGHLMPSSSGMAASSSQLQSPYFSDSGASSALSGALREQYDVVVREASERLYRRIFRLLVATPKLADAMSVVPGGHPASASHLLGGVGRGAGGDATAAVISPFEFDTRYMLRIAHPHIVPCYAAELSPDYRFVDTFMDLCDKSLHARLTTGPISADAAFDVCHGVLSALQHLHDNCRIVHRDLKPQNILFKGDIPRLSDFGTAASITSDDVLRGGITGMAGTLSYMAPEVLLGEPHMFPCDIFSFGCLLAQLLGLQFREQTSDGGLSFGALHAQYRTLPMSSGLAFNADMVLGHRRRRPAASDVAAMQNFMESSVLGRITLACVRRDPFKRPTAAELLSADGGFANRPSSAIVSGVFQDRNVFKEELDNLLSTVREFSGGDGDRAGSRASGRNMSIESRQYAHLSINSERMASLGFASLVSDRQQSGGALGLESAIMPNQAASQGSGGVKKSVGFVDSGTSSPTSSAGLPPLSTRSRGVDALMSSLTSSVDSHGVVHIPGLQARPPDAGSRTAAGQDAASLPSLLPDVTTTSSQRLASIAPAPMASAGAPAAPVREEPPGTTAGATSMMAVADEGHQPFQPLGQVLLERPDPNRLSVSSAEGASRLLGNTVEPLVALVRNPCQTPYQRGDRANVSMDEDEGRKGSDWSSCGDLEATAAAVT